MTEACFICAEANPNVLENHHIVPQRYGGSDSNENLVTLCANCHRAVERLYDERFYSEMRKIVLDEMMNQFGSFVEDGLAKQ